MSENSVSGLASIIIPCWNQLEFTRKCVAALMRQTGGNWELVVVDNGSNDGTGDYLTGVQDASPVPVTLIANATNRGFPAAINQGLEYARGEFLVLLNNDVVVTEGWLGQLVGLASVQEGTAEGGIPKSKIGLVGPMSNYAAPPQLVDDVPYRELDGMGDFARGWRETHRGKWFTVRKLSGFCLLMTRAVYQAVGGLDERFGLGFFDDDDLAERARRAGFELAVAYDLFVHHFGSRTFVGNGVDAERVLDENAKRFAAKWGDSVPQGRRVALRAFSGDGRGERVRAGFTNGVRNGGEKGDGARGGGWSGGDGVGNESLAGIVRLKPDLLQRARVSLTMIVRDEERNLPHCLESVRGVFDEIVVLDTGSRDRTVEIARRSGRGCLISCGLMTSPRRVMRRWRVPGVIMRFGSMPTI